VPSDNESRRAQTVLELVRRYLPVSVKAEGPLAEYNDWTVVAPGLIGAAASILDSIVLLPPPGHTLSAEILTRSLSDYVITFAWLAAEPDNAEQRAERLNRFEAEEYEKREQTDQKYTEEFRRRSKRRKRLFAHYNRLIKAGKMPAGLIDEPTRNRMTARRKVVGDTEMPSLLDRAFQADEYWTEHSEAVRCNPFAHQWGVIFSWHSFVAHPTATALSRVVSPQPDDLSVGVQTASSIGSTPYGRATALLGLMLHVASHSLGWPSEAEIDSAFSARRC